MILINDPYKLIDEDDPKCFYCNSNCDLSSIHSNNTFKNITFHNNTYICVKCKEFYCIHHNNDDPIHRLDFSCNDLIIYYFYPPEEDDEFGIGFGDGNHSQSIKGTLEWVPCFEFNFKNKNKLYNKLKTYLVFV